MRFSVRPTSFHMYISLSIECIACNNDLLNNYVQNIRNLHIDGYESKPPNCIFWIILLFV